MKKIYILFTLLISAIAIGQTTDLYFSKYGEGSSNNKFLEIYNGTGAPVDLINYSVELYSNGAAAASGTLTFTTSTIIAAGDVYVIRNSGASLGSITSAADVSSGACNFNGDDAVALLKSGAVIDVIGSIGTDPGTSWSVAGTTGGTLDHTLIRKLSVCSPNPVNLASFGTDAANSEWVVYPIDGELSQLGSHIGCSTSPSLSITSPSNSSILNPFTTSVSVGLAVFNFTVAANGSGTGAIQYSVDNGAAVMKYDTTPIVLNGLSIGNHSVVVSLVDNNNAQLTPAVSATVSFSIAGISNVATIADLRAGTLNAYYNLTGTAIVSHVRNPSGTVLVATTRNQKFIQDQTGGILIDDSAGKITTTFVEGDAMSNIPGQLVPYNGILEFVPLQDQSVVSANNTIVPETISIADLNTNINNYECELLKFNNIIIEGTVSSTGVFTALASAEVFATGKSYRVTDGTTTGIFRTGFNEADYIGTTVPSTAINAIALGYENVSSANVSTPQFIVRKLSDIINPLNTQTNEIDGLKVYPNPVSNGILHVDSLENTVKSISLFDVLGKLVLKTTTENNTINVSSLKGGIYILKITEAGKTAVSKLVIK